MPKCNRCNNTDKFVEPFLHWDRCSYGGGSEVMDYKNLDVEFYGWSNNHTSYCYECGCKDIDWEYPYLDMPLIDTP